MKERAKENNDSETASTTLGETAHRRQVTQQTIGKSSSIGWRRHCKENGNEIKIVFGTKDASPQNPSFLSDKAHNVSNKAITFVYLQNGRLIDKLNLKQAITSATKPE